MPGLILYPIKKCKKPIAFLLLLVLAYLNSNSNPLVNSTGVSINGSFINHISQSPQSVNEQIRMKLYGFNTDSSTFVVDGILVQYAPAYSNSVDGFDARKFVNPGENMGIIRSGTNLIIERRRTIGFTDTVFLNMWGMRKKTYRMEFAALNLNHPGLEGFLVDNYLQTSTPLNLNDTTRVTFNINDDPVSSSQSRFMIIFTELAPSFTLPLTFTSVNARMQGNQARIAWTTENESNMISYNIQRSGDKLHFAGIATIQAMNLASNNYHWIDAHPENGKNYYRINSTDRDGNQKYSEIIKVDAGVDKKTISIFPNPVIGNKFTVELTNQKEGIYELKLVNTFGQIFLSETLKVTGGKYRIPVNNIPAVPHGIYYLELHKKNGEKQVLNLFL
jgi:hypothetical protein